VTLCTSGVRFVALAGAGSIGATKCTLANQYFVALVRGAATGATFVPHSQQFVARTTGAATSATKRWLPQHPHPAAVDVRRRVRTEHHR
jgi:hypothetical protein